MKIRAALFPIITSAVYLSAMAYLAYYNEMLTQQEDSAMLLTNLGGICLLFLISIGYFAWSMSLMLKQKWCNGLLLLLAGTVSAASPFIHPQSSRIMGKTAITYCTNRNRPLLLWA